MAGNFMLRPRLLLMSLTTAATLWAQANAQEPAPLPAPEQPDWNASATASPSDAAASATGNQPANNPEIAPPEIPAPGSASAPGSSVAASTASPDPSLEVGVPQGSNFFLPNFDNYGRPFLERQGLRFRAGPLQLRFNLTLGAGYNSNIFASQTNKIADYITHIEPGILLGLGDFAAKTEDFLLLNYHPSFDYYLEHSDQNRVNQNLKITGQGTFSRYSTTLDVTYLTSNLPNATQTGGQSYGTFTVDWDNRYYLGAKVFLRALVSANTQTSESDNNYQTFTFSPQLGYAYSPKTTFFVGPFAGTSIIEKGGSQSFQGVTAGFNFTNLRKLQINGSLGVQARQFDGQDTTGASNFITPVFDFTMIYAVGPKTNLNLEFLRNVQLSDIQSGLTYTNSQVNLGFTQTLFRKLSFNLGLTYQLLEYQGNSPTGRTDTYFSVRPAINYPFWRDLFVFSLFYQWQNRSSDVEIFNYDVTSYGVSISYSF